MALVVIIVDLSNHLGWIKRHSASGTLVILNSVVIEPIPLLVKGGTQLVCHLFRMIGLSQLCL
jgi:hypothetical protein